MTKLLDFTYYCVFTVVPDEATLGKAMGASTLHSSMSSMFYFALFLWTVTIILPIHIEPIIFAIIVAIIFGGHFIFNWKYFLREEKQKELAERYGHIKKWKRKLIGISFLLFCFLFFIFSGITMSILRQ